MFCPFCGNELGNAIAFCGSCGSNVQILSEHESPIEVSEEDLLLKYFRDGHTYSVILDILASKHNLKYSLRTLKKKLNRLSLHRRKSYTPLDIVQAAITKELDGPGQHYGYRTMCQTLRQKYSITVKRQDVMRMTADLDPLGVVQRSRRMFVRRVYHSLGPNHTWHIDGYDKLKPYGLAISGCIDGYSRKVMWLVCGASNNNPEVIANHYLQCATEFGVIPNLLRTDCGTENGVMAAIHCILRSNHQDDLAGAASHVYGSSTTNQRIESWWSYFRKQRTQFWMDLLNDLRGRQLFNGSHEHICLVRFVFLGMLQKELDETKEIWNTHTIRAVKQSRCPSGKPDAMYILPHRTTWTSFWLNPLGVCVEMTSFRQTLKIYIHKAI
ncbi:uncharacterized protein LOC130549790 isoform X2 [Triplophysa rosa]|uniref:uncharacterized protein LOC130549790 isoform X2 n=1 Tax=Triplophysa rosa TaxID=992332 RepID=UPI00254622F6|nr:uncharacterized protein LOC130549790 isoform X2 [Triplophysa rosa]